MPADEPFTYRFTALLWEHPSAGAWHFVTLPEELADEIHAITEGAPRKGFGSVRVEVTVEPMSWTTSIFPDSSSDSYVLPVKKEVRRRAGVEAGDDVAVVLRLEDPLGERAQPR